MSGWAGVCDPPRPRERVDCARLPDGSAVLIDGITGAAHAVNATAAEVWALCDGRHTAAQITSALLERYEAPPAEVASSVWTLLLHLQRLGVLEAPTDMAACAAYRACYDVLGFRAEVVSNSADLIATLNRLNTEFVATGSAQPPSARYEAYAYNQGHHWEITCQGERLRPARSLLEAAGRVEWHMMDRTIGWRSDLLHAHGAVLAGPHASLLIPGKSGIGKTTLALALMLRGLCLYSDDVVFLQPETWRPLPFPRTLHLHADAFARLEALGLRYAPEDRLPKYLCASALRPWPREPGPPLRYVLIPERVTEGPPTLTALTQAEAAVHLMHVSRNLRHRPAVAQEVLPRLMAQVECHVLRLTDDLAAAADVVCHLLTGGSPA